MQGYCYLGTIAGVEEGKPAYAYSDSVTLSFSASASLTRSFAVTDAGPATFHLNCYKTGAGNIYLLWPTLHALFVPNKY